MTHQEQHIAQVLRRAPRLNPPSDLEAKLVEQIELSPTGGQNLSHRRAFTCCLKWLTRWWPALGPAAISAACVVSIVIHHSEIKDLRQSIQGLSKIAAPTFSAAPTSAGTANDVRPLSSLDQEQEIKRLTDLATKLRNDVVSLERVQIENEQLRERLAAHSALPNQVETAALEKARARAQSINCLNNLKQLWIAARSWADGNAAEFPMDPVQMGNQIGTSMVLHCPSDTVKTAAPNFSSYSTANCSYDYLAPGIKGKDEPWRVLWRCPIHGHIALCDGSLRIGVSKEHPDWLIEQAGKLFMRSNAILEVGRPAFDSGPELSRDALQGRKQPGSNYQTNP